MNHLHFFANCAAFLACILTRASLLHGADALRPLQVVQVQAGNAAESQVDESPKLQEPRWVIRHSTGLKVMNIKSGTVTDVLTHPRRRTAYGDTSLSRLLTADATVFGYASSDSDSELTIARVGDGSTIVKVDLDKLLGEQQRPSETYLANDASRLWCLSRKTNRIVRIDLVREPRVTASHELKGTRRDAFHLFVSGDDKPLVVAATSSPKGGWFRVFDENLALHYECRLPQAGVQFAVNRPEPLIFVTFPQTTTWQLLRQQGKEFKLVSSASYGPPRPDWNIDGHTLMDAAISPDGKLLVTSQASERPTISVWNPTTGALIRQVELQGGGGYKLDYASHHTIFRLAFSKSGKYLTAADPTNTYLVDVGELVSQSNGNQAE